MDLENALHIAAAGLRVQGTRMRVISENVANADSIAKVQGGDPYRRKIVTFENELDRALGIEKVKIGDIGVDKSEFGRRYQPGHPAADADGYVLTPNVNSMLEMMDMRQAQHSYEANLKVIEISKTMINHTLDLLR